MLLIGELGEIADLAEVRIIFESRIEVLAELARDPRGRREIGFAIFPEADVDDRIDDEFVLGVADADEGRISIANRVWAKGGVSLLNSKLTP